MRKNKTIVCNWKMNPVSDKEAERIFKSSILAIEGKKKSEVIICPPLLYLEKLRSLSKKANLGAQNTFWDDSVSGGGARTGETSATMLYNAGAKYVILGHSERREDIALGGEGETNAIVNKKIKASLVAGLLPILCVGEKERDENHKYLNFIKEQVQECLNGVSKNSLEKIILAYEPIWAIGKKAIREATAEEFREMNIFLLRIMADKFGIKNAEKVRILYGGSVNPKNAKEFLKDGKADGFLLGRASLEPKKFAQILKITEELA